MSKKTNIKELNKIDTKPYKFKRFLRKLRWLLFVYLRPRHDSTIVTRNGVLTFDSKDKTIGRILNIYRNFEFDELIKFIEILKKNDIIEIIESGTVVDIGANIGMISTAFLLEKIFTEAIGFEPDPNNYRLLQKNIQDNGLQESFTAYNIALSNKNETLPFELSEKNFGDHRIRYDEVNEKGSMGENNRKVIAVEAMSFDDFLLANADINQEKIKLVWMDIQGHEPKFLEGATKFLASHPRVPVIMEFWPYGMKRSGTSKKLFYNIIRPLFTKYYDISDDRIHDIEEIGPLFANNESANQGSNLIFFN